MPSWARSPSSIRLSYHARAGLARRRGAQVVAVVPERCHDPHALPCRSPVGFAGSLERHGEAIAVLDVSGARITYRELAERADAVAERLGAVRRLVLLRMG